MEITKEELSKMICKKCGAKSWCPHKMGLKRWAGKSDTYKLKHSRKMSDARYGKKAEQK